MYSHQTYSVERCPEHLGREGQAFYLLARSYDYRMVKLLAWDSPSDGIDHYERQCGDNSWEVLHERDACVAGSTGINPKPPATTKESPGKAWPICFRLK